MLDPDKQPFIPRDKPKFWVVAIIAGLVGVLVAGPIALVGVIYDLPFLNWLGTVVFFSAWTIAAFMWGIFVVGLIQGKYRGIRDLPWSEQLW